MEYKINYSLKDYNTFGIDSCAEEFIEVFSENEIKDILTQKRNNGRNLLILGGGSNILLPDEFKGTALKISIPGLEIIAENNSSVSLKAGAGVIWDTLVESSVGNNFSGVENLSLIPGTVGAAPIQNIGAYGTEISSVFEYLEGYYISDGTFKKFSREECLFGYRNSIFKNELKNKFIITSVVLKLSKKFTPDKSYKQVGDEIKKRGLKKITLHDMRDIIISIRREKLPDPDQLGNAGSFFKNPEISYEEYSLLSSKYPDLRGFDTGSSIKLYSGWLIEKCGWKGTRMGNVGTYPRQALVLVNYGGATAKEILEFADRIKESVRNTFGIILQEEVNIIRS